MKNRQLIAMLQEGDPDGDVTIVKCQLPTGILLTIEHDEKTIYNNYDKRGYKSVPITKLFIGGG